jgi:hypothetical protein
MSPARNRYASIAVPESAEMYSALEKQLTVRSLLTAYGDDCQPITRTFAARDEE